MSTTESRESSIGEPTWEIARLFPNQGTWSESEYLAIDTNQRIEFVDGRLEFPPMPTEIHQVILAFLYRTLHEFVDSRQLGLVLFSGLRVKLWEGRIREPDLVFMSNENRERRSNRFWKGADLAMEIVSEDDPDRDLVEKREEYAKAGIREYWIVDPCDSTITVLTLTDVDKPYDVVGTYGAGEQATSVLLEGFSVSVDEVFSVRNT